MRYHAIVILLLASCGGEFSPHLGPEFETEANTETGGGNTNMTSSTSSSETTSAGTTGGAPGSTSGSSTGGGVTVGSTGSGGITSSGSTTNGTTGMEPDLPPELLVCDLNPEKECFFTQISVGGHSCGVTEDSDIVCWGSNLSGQGDAPPAQGFALVAAGVNHTCGLHPGGLIECWGSNQYGQLDSIPVGAFVQLEPGSDVEVAGREDPDVYPLRFHSSLL